MSYKVILFNIALRTLQPTEGYNIIQNETDDIKKCFEMKMSIVNTERLGYVRNPRSLMEGTETLCRDDIGGFTWKPRTSLTKRKRQ